MVGIKDFKMPSCCGGCRMASCKGLSGQFYCDITVYDVDIDDTERDADCPLVEAIPKANYENRLKADMVAMLTELQQEMDKVSFTRSNDYGVYARTPAEIRKDYSDIIQERINELKEEKDE